MATWLATAAFGLEGVVKNELQALGLNAAAETGGARFEGTQRDAFLANLHLRCADRVQLIVAEQACTSFDALFRFVNGLPWEEILDKNARFPVTGHCARSQLMSVSDCQSITKKAIAERLKQKYRQDWFPETGREYQISITLKNDLARVCLNASGDALNRRGYRTWNGEAPLRETLAAAMVALSPWRRDMPLYDPMCGTGTLLIEAAMKKANMAPGLRRSFAMENWRSFDPRIAAALREEAQTQIDLSSPLNIAGSDVDAQALSLARKHIRQAGLEGHIHVKQMDMRDVRLNDADILFLTNPPYGERLSDRKTAEKIYRDMGRMQQAHPGSRLCCITAHPAFERHYGQRAKKKRRLYNGRLECEFFIY